MEEVKGFSDSKPETESGENPYLKDDNKYSEDCIFCYYARTKVNELYSVSLFPSNPTG